LDTIFQPSTAAANVTVDKAAATATPRKALCMTHLLDTAFRAGSR
jgi:hypothetical protein